MPTARKAPALTFFICSALGLLMSYDVHLITIALCAAGLVARAALVRT